MIKVDATISIKHISRSTSSTLADNLEACHVFIRKCRKLRVVHIFLNTRHIFHLPQYSHMMLRYHAQTFLHGGALAPFSFDQVVQQRH